MTRWLALLLLLDACVPTHAGGQAKRSADSRMCRLIYMVPDRLLCKDAEGRYTVEPNNCEDDSGKVVCLPVLRVVRGGGVQFQQAA